MATATLDDLIAQTRLKANAANTNFVTDTEIIRYLNEALQQFRELVITADDSYYQSTLDFTITAAPGNAQALPADFWKMRGLDGFAGDSLKQAEIYAREFRNRFDPGVGYYFGGDGNSIVVSGRSAEQANPFRLYYTPKAIPLASLLATTTRNISVNAGVDGTNAGGQLILTNAALNAADLGGTLVISNTGNGLDGTWTIVRVVSGTTVEVSPQPPVSTVTNGSTGITLTPSKTASRTFAVAPNDQFDSTDVLNIALGAFGADDLSSYITLAVTPAAYAATYQIRFVNTATSVRTSPSVVSSGNLTGTATVSRQPGGTRSSLDATEDNFSEYFSVRAAMVIARKKRQDTLVAALGGERAAIEDRIAALSRNRQSEPQQAPILWGRRSRYDRDDLDV